MNGRAFLVAVAVAGVACAEAPPPTAHVPAAAAAKLDVEGVLASVVRVRGLSPIGEVEVERLADAAFDAKRAELEIVGDVLVLFDLPHRALYVRRSRETTADARDQLIQFFDAILLEDHFKLLSTITSASDDSNVRIGLLRADEQLTLAGVAATRDDVPISRTIAFAGEVPPDLARDKDAGPVLHMRAMAHEFARPFLGALYRTGGFRLVDTVLAHPPVETRALFDAQAYLDGLARASYEGPLLVASAGQTVTSAPVGGVFIATLVMAGGADEATARALGAALRYGRLEYVGKEGHADDPDPSRLVLVFDDDAHANAFRKFISVDPAAKGPDKGGSPLPKSGSLVGWRKNLVVGAWSPSHDVSSKWLDEALAGAPGPVTRDAKPFGDVRIAKTLQRPDERLKSAPSADTFAVPALDVVFKAPFTYQPVELKGHMIADFRAEGAGGLNALAFEGYLPETEVAGFVRGASKDGGRVELLHVAPRDQPPRPWLRREFSLPDLGVRAALFTRPICDGHATLMLSAWVAMSASFAYATDWAMKVDLSRVEESDYCTWIAEGRKELVFPPR